MVYKKQQIKHLCLECGSEFIGNNLNKYCSKQCKITSRANRSLKKQHEKIINKRLRLKKIKDNFIIGVSIPSKEKEIICKGCNSLFKTTLTKKIYCCKKCRQKDYERNRLLIPFEDRISKNSYLKLRFEILKRDNFQCKYCGRSPKIDNCRLHIDHIIPKSKSGINNSSNLITSCFECNEGKKDVLLNNKELNNNNYNYEK